MTAEGEPRGVELAVHLRRLRKRFGYRDVLRGVDLDVPKGSCFVLSGPNGAGKSTLLRIIATQWTFQLGDVRVLGLDVREEPVRVRSRIGVVFHESFLRPELTLEENLRFSCDLRGTSFRSVGDRAGELLARFGLEHRRRDLVRTYSQGMVKRASLVRSLLYRPELWILDEPFSGLDPLGQEILEETLRGFVSSGGTALIVTHRSDVGRRLATGRAAVVDGCVRPSGGEDEARAHAHAEGGG